MDPRPLEVSWAGLWRALLFVSLAALMYLSMNILLGLFLAVVISSGLEFLVNFLEKRGIPRTLGVILIFLVSALSVIVTVYTVLPLLIIDLNTALLSLDRVAEDSWWGVFLDVRSAQTINELINNFSRDILSGGTSPLEALSGSLASAHMVQHVLLTGW